MTEPHINSGIIYYTEISLEDTYHEKVSINDSLVNTP